MKEAMFYRKGRENKVFCYLCAHHCPIKPGARGKCGVRENHAGSLYTLVYGKAVATAVDPIEKKPLFHFLPGTTSFSLATMGCNFKCQFCQNCEISQVKGEIRGTELSPARAVAMAEERGCRSIAYTYTEPTIFFEYAYDIAREAKTAGLKNIFVTNGFITEEPLTTIAPYLDAANIDLKSFNDDFYHNVVGARLKPVLESIKLSHALGIFVEITTLVIPGYNDSDEELTAIASFIASVDPRIPWHVSRFHPYYHLFNAPITPAATLEKAVSIGKQAGLRYIYAGNVPGNDFESTFCPHCNAKVIDRFQYNIRAIHLDGNRCRKCGAEIYLVPDAQESAKSLKEKIKA